LIVRCLLMRCAAAIGTAVGRTEAVAAAGAADVNGTDLSRALLKSLRQL